MPRQRPMPWCVPLAGISKALSLLPAVILEEHADDGRTKKCGVGQIQIKRLRDTANGGTHYHFQRTRREIIRTAQRYLFIVH